MLKLCTLCKLPHAGTKNRCKSCYLQGKHYRTRYTTMRNNCVLCCINCGRQAPHVLFRQLGPDRYTRKCNTCTKATAHLSRTQRVKLVMMRDSGIMCCTRCGKQPPAVEFGRYQNRTLRYCTKCIAKNHAHTNV